jgi:hypothetical protein
MIELDMSLRSALSGALATAHQWRKQGRPELCCSRSYLLPG